MLLTQTGLLVCTLSTTEIEQYQRKQWRHEKGPFPESRSCTYEHRKVTN
jgi:hypothetical protein